MLVLKRGKKMNIDLIKLKSNIVDYIEIDETLNFTSEDLKDSGILELNKVHVVGDITKDALDDYDINIDVTGEMILPCSVTLKPVKHEFSININDNLSTLFEEIDEKNKNIENSIDIFPIIWENILMEIPMRVVSEEAKDVKLEGNGWKLITEEES